jgi:hypothetical protein
MIYFAYGSNMNPGEIARLCPEFRTLGVARLIDHRLCFPRYSRVLQCAVAGLEPAAGEAVWGVLYDIAEADEPVLQHNEGYDPYGTASANERILRAVTVLRLGGSEPVPAMAFFAVPDGTTERPSAPYLALIVDGAQYHGLPKAYVAALAAVRTA